jgi:hypothetical protein
VAEQAGILVTVRLATLEVRVDLVAEVVAILPQLVAQAPLVKDLAVAQDWTRDQNRVAGVVEPEE